MENQLGKKWEMKCKSGGYRDSGVYGSGWLYCEKLVLSVVVVIRECRTTSDYDRALPHP